MQCHTKWLLGVPGTAPNSRPVRMSEDIRGQYRLRSLSRSHGASKCPGDEASTNQLDDHLMNAVICNSTDIFGTSRKRVGTTGSMMVGTVVI